VDADGAGPAKAWTEYYVYDGAHVALVYRDPDGPSGAQPAVLRSRVLHGEAVDQVLAQEDVTTLSAPGTVLWPLTDHLGTVRDVINSQGQVRNHLVYDAFGKVVSETNAAVDFLFDYTGRERDEETGLHYYRARYYDPAVGRFVSEDPIGFAAGDANLYRYVGNEATGKVDPSGLERDDNIAIHQERREKADHESQAQWKRDERRLRQLRFVLSEILDILQEYGPKRCMPSKYSAFVPHPLRGRPFPLGGGNDAPWTEVYLAVYYTHRTYYRIGRGFHSIHLMSYGVTQNFPGIPGMMIRRDEFYNSSTVIVSLTNFVHEANHDVCRYGFQPYDHATNATSRSPMGMLLRSMDRLFQWLETQYDPVTGKTLFQEIINRSESID
jgi:RHS repeat-associated protein